MANLLTDITYLILSIGGVAIAVILLAHPWKVQAEVTENG